MMPMVTNEALNTIVSDVTARRMGGAMAHLESYLSAFVQPQAMEQLAELKADYERMSSYWLKGTDDPQRGQLYEQLLRRLYVLTMNVYIRYCINNSSYLKSIYTQARAHRQDWSVTSLRRDMEAYVSDVALLELDPEHTRQSRQKALFEQHQQFMASLFDYIWTSRLWTDGVTEAFCEMLLSPTIDTMDQQLMVSAITLSMLNFFGINKFRLLVNVYMKSTDEHVRQRALVGWVLCLNSQVARLYPEMLDLVKTATQDDHRLSELAELQMQMIYCLRTESDQQIIQSEIMPELMKSGNIRVTRNGIEEQEDDPLEDVLHPEQAEQRMEKLEASMKRMNDMQRQGSDVYFGGFSQMKRFPFFSVVANWFMPFYLHHPGITGILDHVRGRRFLLSLLKNGPFCDSDKYSFVLGYQMAVSRMPENLLEMMDRGEAMLVGGEIAVEELATPAFFRRSYLQNLYRFFRVYPQRGEFVNPFDVTQQPRYLFFANSLFRQTRLEEKFGEMVAFLLKQKAYDAARLVLQNYRSERRDAQFFLLCGTLLARTHTERCAGLTAADCYGRLLQLEPENERAWNGYARAMFDSGDYQAALDYYRRLVASHPDHLGHQLNAAVCMANLGQYEEALQVLYKLNYESPDNHGVSRVLAWTLMDSGRYEQALKLYQQLLAVDSPESGDLLNHAYCLWFSGDVAGAVDAFSRYARLDGVSFNAAEEFLQTEARFISAHGVGDVEVRLMIDVLG